VDGRESLEFVRLWPDTVDSTRSAKKVYVYVDDRQLFEGEVDDTFGTLINLAGGTGPDLSQEMKEVLAAGPNSRTKRIRDRHGECMPLYEFRMLEFQILGTYSNPNIFGLSMIRLYDLNGNLVDVEPDRAIFEVDDCVASAEVSRLFVKRVRELGETFLPWRGSFTGKIPRVMVRFEEPLRVLAIEIVNVDIAHTDDDISVRGMHILADNKSFWIGKLNRRAPGSSDVKPNSTFVFTICGPDVRALVMGNR
jgi:hypothetical protein